MKRTLQIDYQPMILPERPDMELLQSASYRRFLLATTVEAGLRFFMTRQRSVKSWPFLDTKFNPNTGQELPPSSHDVIHTWMFGRGVEALVLHLEILDELEFSEGEKAEARSLFQTAIWNMCDAILGIAANHHGRIPFKVDRRLRVVGETPDSRLVAPADLFCGKGLLVSPELSDRDAGMAMLTILADRISSGQIEPSGDPSYRGMLSQAMRMLFLSVPRLLENRIPAGDQEALQRAACGFIEFVMDRHFDPDSNRFSEWIDPSTGERGHLLDPGHCAEFVGLAFSSIRSIERGPTGIPSGCSALFQRARAILPRILLSAFQAGFNHPLGGMHKAVDNRTRKILDASMPWWNLPETMRAALFAADASPEEGIRKECLRIFAMCHNAYFTHYINRANGLFPFQTRCGETGEVLDAAPAVPEGDPLYHTNLCVLEILSVLENTPEPEHWSVPEKGL